MTRAAGIPAVAAVMTVAAAFTLLGPVVAQSPRPLAYRRVYVPADALDGQIRGLLPLKRDEFDRRLKRAEMLSDPTSGQSQVRIDEAVFRARLDGNQLRDGSMDLVVTSSRAEPSLLSLDPCNVVFESAVWESDSRPAAVIGVDASGVLRSLVDQSGRLHLRWNLAGAETAAGETTFSLQLPLALQRRLEIIAPANIELSVDSGLVSRGQPPAESPHLRKWTIELGGQPQVTLRARPELSQSDAGSFAAVRESATYTVLQSTLDVQATLTLDILRQPLERLELQVDRPLQLISVRLGDQNLAFSAADGDKSHSTAIVELPAGLVGFGRAVEIAATAEWTTDSRMALPRIRLAGGVLQEGRAEINAPAWLRLQPRPLGGALQTHAAPGAAGRGNDRFEFQLFKPDAAIEIASDQAAAPLDEQSGTQITVEANQVMGVLVAELASPGMSRFSVDALVPRQWIVDAVETEPPEMLADRTLTARGGGPQQLHLKLSRAVTSQRPLRLIIRAHYRRPANNRPLAEGFFRLVNFSDVRNARRLVSVRVNDSGASLKLLDDEGLARLHPSQLSAAEQRLFESPPGPLLFETANERVQAAFEGATARFRANVVVRCAAERGALTHTVAIRCQPEASAVGSLMVRLAPRPHSDITWRLVGEESRELLAVLENSPQTSPAADDVAYRLVLPRPISSAFEVVGTWSAPQASGGEVSLAWLPEATRQTGLVEIHSPDSGLDIKTSDVQPLPRPPADDDRLATLRGRYQYEAGRRGKIEMEPVSGVAAAWIETLELTSHFRPDGGGEHEAALRVSNAGSSAFSIRLPPGISNLRLSVDDAEVHTPQNFGADDQIVVPLPRQQHFASVRLRYSSDRPLLGPWPMGRLVAPIPQIELPVVAQTWVVRLPPELSSTSGRPSLSSQDDSVPASKTWSIRSLMSAFAGPRLAERLSRSPQPAGQSSADSTFAGWNRIRLDLPRGSEATLAVYRPVVVSAWSLCIGLCLTALVASVPGRLPWIATAAGLLAAGSVASDLPLAWLLAGASVGLVSGGIWRLFRPSRRTGSPRAADQRSSLPIPVPSGASPSVISASAFILFVLIACARCLVAAVPDTPPPPDVPFRRVVFPIDENNQPAGDYVFLDPALYDSLHRLSDVRPVGVPAWLLESARYEVLATPGSRARGAAVDELRSIFDFHTFQALATIHLPLKRDQVVLLEGTARLDGQPVSLAWQADGLALSFPVETPGKHRLELALGATARRMPDAAVLELAIPEAAISTVFVPPNATVSGEVSAPERGLAATGDERLFHLGRSGRLVVRWPANDASLAASAMLEADQLLWWKVRPGSCVLEARFRIRPLGGQVKQAIVEVDPRLRLLPGLVSGQVARVAIEEGTINRVKVDLAEPTAGEILFRLGWLWPDATGVGTLLLPTATLRADQLTRDWTAISAEPGLEMVNPPANDAGPTAAEFTEAWGDANVVPSLVQGNLRGKRSSSIVVRPVLTAPSAEQSMDWSFSAALAEALCTIRFSGVDPSRFEHRVSLPPQMKVSRVTLTQAGRPASLRWARQSDGLLVVTLLEPPAREQTLAIAAQFTPPQNRPQFRLPAIVPQDVQLSMSRLRVYRRHDVQLQIQPAAGWTPAEPAELGRFRQGLGRLAASLASDQTGKPPPTVSRSTNRPRVTGTMFTRADQADGDWRCEARLQLEVADGVLDELRLAIPEEWSAPLEIDPPWEQSIEAVPGETGRQLTIRPLAAVSGKLELALRGPLFNGASGVQVPDVTVQGSPAIKRLVLLDRGSAGERIDWEITGLLAAAADESADLPVDWRDVRGDWYRVVGRRFDATARLRQTTSATPRIHLADFRATIWPARRVQIVAEMIVHPAGARNVAFTLVPGCRLVQTLVDGSHVPPRVSGLRSWTIAAPSDVLPFRLTIVCDTFLPAGSVDHNSLTIPAPQIVGMGVQQSLWTVVLKDDNARTLDLATLTVGGPSGRRVPWQAQSEAEIVRLEASAQALEDIIAAQGANLPASVLAEGFVRWQGLAEGARQRFLSSRSQGAAPSDLSERMQAAADRVQKVGQRLVQAGIVTDSQILPSHHRIGDDEPAASACIVAPGLAAELQLTWPRERPQWPLSRSALAGLMAVGALVLWPLGRAVSVRNWLLAHAPFVLAAAAIGWWLLAPFGWLAWPLLLAAVWFSIRSPWPRASYEAGSQTFKVGRRGPSATSAAS